MGGTFDTLRGGSRARLEKMRRYRDNWNAKRAEQPWRQPFTGSAIEARRHGAGQWNTGAHGLRIEPDARYIAAPLELVDGWRDVGASDELVRIGHSGWYASAHENSGTIYRGHVWQLPARAGSPVYVAGYTETEGGENCSGYCVLECNRGALALYDEKEDAARAGDSLAERNAEDEREYSERWQEASEASDERDEARTDSHAARQRFAALAKAWRVCKAAGEDGEANALASLMEDERNKAREAVDTMREKTARIAELGMTGEF